MPSNLERNNYGNQRYPRRGHFHPESLHRAEDFLRQGISIWTAAAGLLARCDFFLKVAESSFERSAVIRMRCRCKLLLDTGARKLKAFPVPLPLLLFG